MDKYYASFFSALARIYDGECYLDDKNKFMQQLHERRV